MSLDTRRDIGTTSVDRSSNCCADLPLSQPFPNKSPALGRGLSLPPPPRWLLSRTWSHLSAPGRSYPHLPAPARTCPHLSLTRR